MDVKVYANEKFKWSTIAAVELELVRTIVRQSTVHVLQQADQIEQRSDVRVRLAVVVTEQAFVVTSKARVGVRSDELIVIGRSLRCREGQRAIITSRVTEAGDRRKTA